MAVAVSAYTVSCDHFGRKRPQEMRTRNVRFQLFWGEEGRRGGRGRGLGWKPRSGGQELVLTPRTPGVGQWLWVSSVAP